MKPILMSVPMAHAIVENRKRMTRRVINPQPDAEGISKLVDGPWIDTSERKYRCPYQPGDILYVKEATWMFCEKWRNGLTATGRQKWRHVPLSHWPFYYCADHPEKPTDVVGHPITRNGNEWGWHKKIGMFMPRLAARLFLEVTAVRVERLQAISEDDAEAEGVFPEFEMSFADFVHKRATPESTHYLGFKHLWGELHADRPGCSWNDNPWVFVIEFRRVEQ